MVIVSHSAAGLKGFLAHIGLNELARTMVLRVVLAFIRHRGRMRCSAAAGSVASEPIHRGELTRFMARPRWQRHNFNYPLIKLLLAQETQRGKFLFLIDATLVCQAGQKTQNTSSTSNWQHRKIKKGCRYHKKNGSSRFYERGERWALGSDLPESVQVPTIPPKSFSNSSHRMTCREVVDCRADHSPNRPFQPISLIERVD
ncbi:MAG: hypothetical protein AB7U20_16995 [Planctomycetaceae bacterium]